MACSVGWRHLSEDPVRALVLGWRVLPPRWRPVLRLAGPYGRAVAGWGSGDRDAALRPLARWASRQAAFA
ncbi:MAG: glycosyltransferase WbuB, partial [Actinobacteria bacterium]|nr:glycosyltransferase WbuB [Actinomycetota bacterium]